MCANSTTSSKEQRTRVFIASANAVLKQCGATAVEEFQIKFPFDNLLVDHLNNWVKFAVLSRAKNLAIELEPEDLRCCKHRHVFPFELFDKQSMSRLEAIRLSFVSLKAQPNFSGFPNLKALDISSVDVSSNDLQLVLSSCSNLERLSIVMCHPHDDIRVSLPRLQHLHVAHSCINKIHFISKNLRTFVYDGFMVPLDLSESLQLGHVEMNFPSLTLEHAITELPRAMPHAQNLNLSACMTLKVFYLPEVVTKFSHLKYLQLRLYFSGQDNLLSLASFLKAAPLLEELDIHVSYHHLIPYNAYLLYYLLPILHCLHVFSVTEEATVQRRSFPLNDFEKLPIRSLPPCRHGHLKRVLITGFHGARGEIELAAHVADNSTRLQALVIDPVMRDVDRNMPALTPEGRAMYWDLARKNAKKYLARRVAQGARFDVL
ncbi:uncharacterized protein [Aegilops tauschii subsp. strangulata]|uniref:uncharacterized protein n=1 Tax=Aegilops tauschii subsp. strangulata TaxID=200361 RepID=UPI003CC88AE9